MGQEIECRMRYGKRSLAGKAYLETDYLLFRGDERVKIAFQDLTSVHASAGMLRLDFAAGPAELELGKAAEKWAEKILHPPSRLDKLGVKAGATVRLVGEVGAGVVEEMRGSGAVLASDAEIVFLAAATSADLREVRKPGRGALWVIFPKGVATVRE